MAFSKSFSPESGESPYTLQNLESGDSVKLRVMSLVLSGYSLWSEVDGKPLALRAEEREGIDTSKAAINKLTGKPNKIKQFVAMIVWNYKSNRFEILETDKSTIIKKLWAMDQDPDLGDLREYDIKLSKTGKGTDTRYEVMSLGKAEVDGKIQKDFEDLPNDLTALFRGENPFEESFNPEEV